MVDEPTPESALAEQIRRQLRQQIRQTMQDMAVAIQNATGCPHRDALAYLVAEARWVEAYYAQQDRSTIVGLVRPKEGEGESDVRPEG